MLPLQVRVDLGTKVMKRFPTFPKAPKYWSLIIRWSCTIWRIPILGGGGFLTSQQRCSLCILQPYPIGLGLVDMLEEWILQYQLLLNLSWLFWSSIPTIIFLKHISQFQINFHGHSFAHQIKTLVEYFIRSGKDKFENVFIIQTDRRTNFQHHFLKKDDIYSLFLM